MVCPLYFPPSSSSQLAAVFALSGWAQDGKILTNSLVSSMVLCHQIFQMLAYVQILASYMLLWLFEDFSVVAVECLGLVL